MRWWWERRLRWGRGDIVWFGYGINGWGGWYSSIFEWSSRSGEFVDCAVELDGVGLTYENVFSSKSPVFFGFAGDDGTLGGEWLWGATWTGP